LFYDKEDGSPKFHWCLFVQIEEKIDEMSWLGFTSFYEKVTLVIEKDSEQIPSTFLWSDLKKGNTAAILYAEKTKSLVVETCLDFVFVFKSNESFILSRCQNMNIFKSRSVSKSLNLINSLSFFSNYR
jgi:hypothetical protein